MSDYALNLETQDLATTGGDFSLTSGKDAIRQAIEMKLRMVIREWFLDRTKGTNYYGKILGNHSFAEIDSELKRVILTTPGVTGFLDPIQYNREGPTRVLVAQFRVNTDEGELSFQEPLSPIG